MTPALRAELAFAAAALVACGEAPGVALRITDATVTDASTSAPEDAAPADASVAQAADAATPGADAAPAPADAAPSALDALSSPTDAAPSPTDAAPSPADALPVAQDAAPPVEDAFVHTAADAADAAPTVTERLAACDSDPRLAGRLVADESGWGHVPEGTEVAYGNNPPASGPHYNQWVRSGVYAEAIERRNWVHNLEHGWLVLLHRPDAPRAQIDALAAAYAQGFDDAQCPNGPVTRVVVTPDPLLPTPVAAVTAFRALPADSIDRATLEAMYAHCREAAPERAVCADGRVPVVSSAPP